MDTTTALFLLLTVAVVTATITDLAHRISARRAKAKSEEAEKQFRKQLARSADEAMRALGFRHIHACDLTDIKYGDEVFWAPAPGIAGTTYIAGYDGDPGPSTKGMHGKEIKHHD